MKMIKSCVFALFMFMALPTVTACAEEPLLTDQIVIEKADGETFYFTVELAVTPSQQATGLMNRTSLEPGSGMLFVFGSEEDRTFWMKDTLIPKSAPTRGWPTS